MNEYSDFKPVDRSRAYTWHGSHSGIEDGRNTASKFAVNVQNYTMDSASSSVASSSKKPWSRRNAWGSMSYADLIGKAIESTADKRLTLSQIYEWMVQNVPYFHDKGTGSSSTGWKNSIRHNLSLHRRFKRVPNEDSGKSSWWMLNDAPDQCHPTRKRTVSVGKFEGKDSSTDLAAPSAKVSHVAPELMKTSQNIGCSSANWLQTVQPLSTYDSGTARIPKFAQMKWHQPSTETDPFFVADLDPAFASPSYTPTSCTPLAPISELLPPQQFSSYDLQVVGIPSPYIGIQTASAEQPSFAGHSLTALSSVTMLDAGSQPSLETYDEAGPTSSESPVVVDSLSASGTVKGLQAQGVPWTPGWSMLRQMLSQSHRENALMHGVASDSRCDTASSAADYLHSCDNRPLQPSATTTLQFVSSPITDHGFSYVTSPQSVNPSDILYVEMTADTDDMAVIQQPIPITASDVDGSTQQQSVITGYSNVLTAPDLSVPQTVETGNNNENEEKSV